MTNQAMNTPQHAEPLYYVIGYKEPADERVTLADNIPHRQAWQIARKAMDENALIYAVSVRAMKQGGKDD